MVSFANYITNSHPPPLGDRELHLLVRMGTRYLFKEVFPVEWGNCIRSRASKPEFTLTGPFHPA